MPSAILEKTFSSLTATAGDAAGLADLLQDPDAVIKESPLLKDGGSATVAKFQAGGKAYVLKRYNLKNFWHRLRRAFRPTRAWHSWEAGRKLLEIGLATPRPLWVKESRWGVLRGTGYLVTEFCSGENLLAFSQSAPEKVMVEIVREFERLLTILREQKIAHGDFKASNFIWNGALNLIDLDSLKWFKNLGRWRKAYNADLDRLLANWPEGTPMHKALAGMIKQFRQ